MKPKKKLTEADVRGLVALRRGALRQTPEGLRCRFIPARAGNTAMVSDRSQTERVHPRSRGEHERRG